MKSRFLEFALILLILISCKQKEFEEVKNDIHVSNDSIQTTKIEYGSKFFDYDEIDYFSIDISEENAMELLDNQNSKLHELKYDVIANDEYPKSLNEMEFLKNLLEIGFIKTKIKTEKFAGLNQILIEKIEQDGVTFACIPVFRDLLVFKKKNKIIGFMKICFDCNQFHIVGTSANIRNFGQGQDYEKLGQLLESN